MVTVGLGVRSSRRYLLGSILSPEGRLTYLTVLTDSDFREVSIVQPEPWAGDCAYIPVLLQAQQPKIEVDLSAMVKFSAIVKESHVD